jgi:hypothetical protein
MNCSGQRGRVTKKERSFRWKKTMDGPGSDGGRAIVEGESIQRGLRKGRRCRGRSRLRSDERKRWASSDALTAGWGRPQGLWRACRAGWAGLRGRAGAGRMQSALGLPQVLEWDKGVIGNEPSMAPHEDGERRAAGGAGRGGQGCSNSTEGSSRGRRTR